MKVVYSRHMDGMHQNGERTVRSEEVRKLAALVPRRNNKRVMESENGKRAGLVYYFWKIPRHFVIHYLRIRTFMRIV